MGASRSPLADAAARAPKRPGVYLFLGDHRELLYIGKAGDLRRRLQQHAQRHSARASGVRAVVWDETASEEAAAAREADLIVALRPPHNAFTDRGTWAYVVVVEKDTGTLRFELVDELPRELGRMDRAYGCFPHLGKGVIFAPAIACSDGYTAFLRLLWAASGDGTHMPAGITRSAPLGFEVLVDPQLRSQLHAFLAGTSARLLDSLAVRAKRRDAYMQPALTRDRVDASGFFTYGSRAWRALRLRHGRPPGVLSREEIENLLTEELRAVIGEFSVGGAAQMSMSP